MLIITGTLAYDHIMNFPGKFSHHILPDKIDSLNVSFIMNTFARHRGGTAGNVSYGLGLFGVQHKLFSIAGKDFNEYKQTFTALGINTDHIQIDSEEYTATGFAMTDTSSNQIWGYYYGAAKKIANLELKKVASKNDFVLIGPSGVEGSLSMVRQTAELGLPYMYDPGFTLTQITDEELTYGIQHSTYLIGNEYEITLIKSRLPNYNNITRGKTIITTLGEKGAIIEEQGTTIEIKPAKVKRIVDPTGAGDSWRAGFLAGKETGFDTKTSGQMGALIAGYTVEQYGTQEHKFTIEEFKKRYRQNYRSLLPL